MSDALAVWEIRRDDGTVLARWLGDETYLVWGPGVLPTGDHALYRNDAIQARVVDGVTVRP